MEYKYKQLEQELSGLSKVFSDLGARLSEAAREVAAAGVLPSEKLLEQISSSRASFESARASVHSHATAMQVSSLPKPGELTSIGAIGSLLKAAAEAEECKLSIEAEREHALKTLARALTLAHRDIAEFKPLQECHTKLVELRNAVYNAAWPHRHPDSESLATFKHPATALLNFVENLDTIEDEKWMALETTISGAFGKPLFVAASRGKLEVREENKTGVQPKAETAKVETKPVETIKPEPIQAAAVTPPATPQEKAPLASAPEPPKPAVTAEKPVEKPVTAEKIVEKPTVVPAVVSPIPSAPAAAQPAATQPALAPKKTVTPAVPQAPAPVAAPTAAAVAEKREMAQEKSSPVTLTAAPEPAPRGAEKPVPAATTQPVAQTPAIAAVAPPSLTVVPPSPPRVAALAPVLSTPPPTPAAPPVPAAPTAETNSHAQPVSAGPAISPAPVSATINSLSALASATEPAIERKPAVPVPPDLAIHTPQPLSKPEQSLTNGLAAGEEHKPSEGDPQRPQRWGFWRGNR